MLSQPPLRQIQLLIGLKKNNIAYLLLIQMILQLAVASIPNLTKVMLLKLGVLPFLILKTYTVQMML
jgi:hypothetical protein